ncbi:Aste57867_20531 [Aphanomyces stellatus]|uniref:Aste57867_20531 protein n=1 Tax=Aphanomyces stellatus TaxID=120398 RepID=A0A485LFW3_9STRA|nr:hypothetical protein As57867_020464 [Aphanomyces stellatus]VFT97216.1 Aste57867_20531 [Aphanomyces stellatus]
MSRPETINDVTPETLELPGIGPHLTRRNLHYRPFESMDAVRKITGFGDKRVEVLRTHLKPLEESSSSMPQTPPPTHDITAVPTLSPRQDRTIDVDDSNILSDPSVLDINTCSLKALQSIPSIGRTLSTRIVQHRPYASLDQVRLLDGVGPNRMAAIMRHCKVVVEPKATSSTKGYKEDDAQHPHTLALLDINTCASKALESIPGIGRTLSSRIILHRPYSSLDQVRLVDGVGPNRMAAILRHCKVQEASPPPASTNMESLSININTCSLKTLQSIPGIGSTLSSRIVAYRPFASLEDVRLVQGIYTTKWEAIKRFCQPIVPPSPPPQTQQSTVKPLTALLDINTCSVKALQTIPGIGGTLSSRIVQHRPYTSLDQVGWLEGIGPARLAAIQSHCMPVLDVIPSKAEPWVTQEDDDSLVDLNTCSTKALEAIPGIGRTLSSRLVQHRPYASFDQVRLVEGVGPNRLAAIVKHCRVPTTRPVVRPTKAQDTQLVDINTCSTKTLQTIPGIGPTLSSRIVHHRPYASLDQVPRLVDGVGPNRMAVIARHCFVATNSTPATPPPQSSNPAKPMRQDNMVKEDAKTTKEDLETTTTRPPPRTSKERDTPFVEMDCSNMRYLPRTLDCRLRDFSTTVAFDLPAGRNRTTHGVDRQTNHRTAPRASVTSWTNHDLVF